MIAPALGPVHVGAVLLLVLFFAGCGERRNAAPVSGKVTVNGQPVADVGVNFEPVGSGAGRGSFGRTDASGNYSLSFIDNGQSGAMIGRHQITFTDMQNIGGSDEPDGGPALKPRKSRLPASALSQPQEFEVKSGSNQADFDLK
jgi:hypothetical protein